MQIPSTRTLVAALAATVALALVACSGGAAEERDDTPSTAVATTSPADNQTDSSGGSGSSSDGGTDITVAPRVTETVAPVISLPKDDRIELGEAVSERQDLADACADAVAPIRELMEVKVSGVLLDDTEREQLSRGLAAGRAACDRADWVAFQRDELHGWMYAAVD
jgi:hypothetical protein